MKNSRKIPDNKLVRKFTGWDAFIVLLVIGVFVGGYYFGTKDILHNTRTMIYPSTVFPSEGNYYFTNGSRIILDYSNANVNISNLVESQSMWPIISDSARIITQSDFKQKDLHVGDIIVFNCVNDQKNTVGKFAHRIISIEKEDGRARYITQGDNNKVNDENGFGCDVTFSDVEFKVIGVLY